MSMINEGQTMGYIKERYVGRWVAVDIRSYGNGIITIQGYIDDYDPVTGMAGIRLIPTNEHPIIVNELNYIVVAQEMIRIVDNYLVEDDVRSLIEMALALKDKEMFLSYSDMLGNMKELNCNVKFVG